MNDESWKSGKRAGEPEEVQEWRITKIAIWGFGIFIVGLLVLGLALRYYKPPDPVETARFAQYQKMFAEQQELLALESQIENCQRFARIPGYAQSTADMRTCKTTVARLPEYNQRATAHNVFMRTSGNSFTRAETLPRGAGTELRATLPLMDDPEAARKAS